MSLRYLFFKPGRPARLSAAVCIVFLFCANAAPAFQAGVTDVPILSSKFGRFGWPADFLIVVDRSRSMHKLWPAVRSATGDFVESLSSGDYLSVLCFDGTAGERLTARRISLENRTSVAREIRELPDPGGSYEDLGYASGRILEELSRPDANRLQFVFILTDFVHQPRPGSRWTSRSPQDQAWRDLAAKRRRLLDNERHTVVVYALALPISHLAGRDLPLVRSVFGRIEQVTVGDRTALRDWFERRRAGLARERIRILASEELRQGGVNLVLPDLSNIRLPNGGVLRVRGRLQSKYRVLNADVEQARLEGRSGQVTASMTLPRARLAPKAFEEVELTIRGARRSGFALPGCAAFQFDSKITVHANVQPAEELQILNLPPTAERVYHVKVAGCVPNGQPWCRANQAAPLGRTSE